MPTQFPLTSSSEEPSKSIYTSGLIIKIAANRGDNETVEERAAGGGVEQISDSLRGLMDISVEIAVLSLRGVFFESVLPDARSGLDRRKYKAMKTYFNDLMDRFAAYGTNWMIISSAKEKKLYDSYFDVIDIMLQTDIITVKDGGRYRFNMFDAHCRAYRLKNQADRLDKEVKVTQFSTNDFIARAAKNKQQKKNKDTPVDLKYLEELMLQLQFDHIACAAELRTTKVDQQLLMQYNANIIKKEDFLDKTLTKNELTGLFSFLQDLAKQDVSPSRSEKNGRISTQYINLPSRWRKHLSLANVKLEEYDISSCHAAIWIKMFAEDIGEKEVLKNAFQEGRFYDLFVSTGATRSFIKKQFLSWVNGDRGHAKESVVNGKKVRVFKPKKFGSHPLDKIIAKVAPNFARLVRSIDINGKYARSEFACLHMQWEAVMMVDRMLPWAAENKLVYLPVHDGWMTIPEHAAQITEKVKALWLEHCEMTPKVVKYC